MAEEEQPSAGPDAPDSDELFALIVESATGFAIFTVDAEGLVTSWNVGAERLIGFTDAEISGRTGDVIFTPEDRANGAPETERRDALIHGRAQDERWHMRKDGDRFWGSGLMMPLRGGAGFVKIMRDLTEKHRAEEELRESEGRFRKLATSIPQLVFRTMPSGSRTWGSPQWAVFTGLSDEHSRRFQWLDAIHPDDRAATLAAWDEAQRTGEYYVEHRVRRFADGEYRWHQTRAAPIDDDEKGAGEWVGTSADINDLRGLQARQGVLLAELQHRTRNLLAVVQAMARQSLRTNPSLESFATEFEGRLRALSRVQGLLARSDYDAIDLRGILEAELTAHGAGEAVKAKIDGPPVALRPVSAQAVALALHELATNAVKYGALSQPDARLEVLWRIDEQSGRRVAKLDWRESGVNMPNEASPKRKGYGRELIERALPYQLDAQTKLEFGDDGVRCSITVPLAVSRGEASHG